MREKTATSDKKASTRAMRPSDMSFEGRILVGSHLTDGGVVDRGNPAIAEYPECQRLSQTMVAQRKPSPYFHYARHDLSRVNPEFSDQIDGNAISAKVNEPKNVAQSYAWLGFQREWGIESVACGGREIFLPSPAD